MLHIEIWENVECWCLTGEVWEHISGYEGMYEVSNFGRVRSLDRWVNAKGGAKRLVEGRVRRQTRNEKGYLQVNLHKEGKRHTYCVHFLVARVFVPNLENLPIINHIDGCLLNNQADNLNWHTHVENAIKAFENGLRPRGSAHYRTTLTEDNVKSIREKYLRKTHSLEELGTLYSVSANTIWLIVSGKTWKHLLKDTVQSE